VSGIVLVTGAGGFVGRHAVADLVARGFTVHGVGRRPPHDDAITWHRADLLDGGARAALLHAVRPSHLLHLAWETRHGYFWSAPENLAWAEATQDLVRRFREGGGARAVVAGSCAEYDWSPEALGGGDCYETTTPCRPATPYGQAKLATFEAVSAAAASGLSIAWGRLFLLYGPHEGAARLVPSLIHALLAGEPVALKEPTAVHDFLHAADAGAAFAALLASDVEGPVNIASGNGVAVAQVARIIGADDSRIDQDLALPDGSPARLVADVSRLRDAVGFTPRHDLESGLAETVAWWRARS
jgi:nucleoside-diphosphate-sugar epimerase